IVARMIGMLVGISILTALGLHTLYVKAASLPSPLVLCPQNPGHCPQADALIVNAVVDELHTIFVGAAICAAVAGLLAAVLLRRPRAGAGVALTPAG
ncbi:MAG TPA: hypothetical protein VE219_03275, partial [Candidatus Sulfotelmatobacter sp.]|nr:hypothetical protein [Candidatus Sulfotelmatobacter sp.]